MDTRSHNPVETSQGHAPVFRGATALVGCYLALSVLTLAAVVVLRDDVALVNAAVWTRCAIVVATAVPMFAFARRAAHGSRTGYRRVRIMSAVMVVAIACVIAIPGPFPLWVEIEQGVCGLLLAGVVVIVNGRRSRSLFAAAE